MMLNNVTTFPRQGDTQDLREIPELSLEEMLAALQHKSGMSGCERDFIARLRGGHCPTEGDLRVARAIWLRHRAPGRPDWRKGAS